jgi:hypothetical protein
VPFLVPRDEEEPLPAVEWAEVHMIVMQQREARARGPRDREQLLAPVRETAALGHKVDDGRRFGPFGRFEPLGAILHRVLVEHLEQTLAARARRDRCHRLELSVQTLEHPRDAAFDLGEVPHQLRRCPHVG